MRRVLPVLLALVALALPLSTPARAGTPDPALSTGPGDSIIVFDTELLSLNLTGGPYPMPLASDPLNLLGDSIMGYGIVNSQVTITLSSQRAVLPGPRSPGKACAAPGFGDSGGQGCRPPFPPLLPIDPLLFDGEQFTVDSFFDVFFDITVTDIDPRAGRDYPGQADGASFQLLDNGPAAMQSHYQRNFDKNGFNYGLVPPPENRPYIGHFQVQIPIGGDINGNGENDKIKFTFAAHSAGDANRNFTVLPDGTVIDGFDSAAFLAGAVVDSSADPTFQIGDTLPDGTPDPASFAGPTTASSKILNPEQPIPTKPTTWGILKHKYE